MIRVIVGEEDDGNVSRDANMADISVPRQSSLFGHAPKKDQEL